jgi:hypothetical protein
MSKKILIIVSNAHVIGPHNRRTGIFLPEVAHAYVEFDEADYQIDFASLTGDSFSAPGAPRRLAEGLQHVVEGWGILP